MIQDKEKLKKYVTDLASLQFDYLLVGHGNAVKGNISQKLMNAVNSLK